MSENRQLRPWLCTCCGKAEMSKGGGSRSFANPFSTIAILRNFVCASVVPDPQRPAHEELVFERDFRTSFSRLKQGQDVQLRVEIYDDFDRCPSMDGSYRDADDEHSALARFFSLIRRLKPHEEKQLICDLLHRHKWTDDSAVIAAFREKHPEMFAREEEMA